MLCELSKKCFSRWNVQNSSLLEMSTCFSSLSHSTLSNDSDRAPHDKVCPLDLWNSISDDVSRCLLCIYCSHRKFQRITCLPRFVVVLLLVLLLHFNIWLSCPHHFRTYSNILLIRFSPQRYSFSSAAPPRPTWMRRTRRQGTSTSLHIFERGFFFILLNSSSRFKSGNISPNVTKLHVESSFSSAISSHNFTSCLDLRERSAVPPKRRAHGVVTSLRRVGRVR